MLESEVNSIESRALSFTEEMSDSSEDSSCLTASKEFAKTIEDTIVFEEGLKGNMHDSNSYNGQPQQ